MTTAAKKTLLVLNDDPQLVEALRDVLEQEGHYRVETRLTRSVEDVLAVRPALVIIDAPPGDITGTVNFVQRVRLNRATEAIPIVITSSSLRHVEPEVLREELIEVLVKPYTIDRLLTAIDTLCAAAHRQDAGRTRAAER